MAIVQSKTFSIHTATNAYTVSFDNEFTTGNSIVICVVSRNNTWATPSTLSTITNNKSHTITRRTNVHRVPTSDIMDLWAEVYDCIQAVDNSPSTKITFTFTPVTSNTNNTGFGVIFEVSDITTFALSGTVSGGDPDTGSVSSATAVPTTLPQIAFSTMCTFNSSVVPPTGWNSELVVQSRAGVAWREVTTAQSITATWQYAAGIYGGGCVIASYNVTAPVTLRIKFELDPATFTSDDTAVEGYLWTEGFPDTHLAKFYSGLAGHATAGKLYITSGLPAGLVANQQVKGIFHNGTYTTGLITGIVEAV